MIPLLVLLAYPFPTWPLASSDVEKLADGITLIRDFEDDGLKGSTVRFWVKSPLKAVYEILADVPAMPLYMPSLKAVRVAEDRGAIKVLEYRSQVPLVSDFTLERHFEPPKRIWWTKVKAPYKRIEGEWMLAPAAGGTVLSYSLAVETGMLIPNWMAVEFQKQGSSNISRNVRKRVESGGTWIRPDYDGPRSSSK